MNLQGTVTGRFQSSISNIVELPEGKRKRKKLRQFLVPKKDTEFVQVDFSKIEKRLKDEFGRTTKV